MVLQTVPPKPLKLGPKQQPMPLPQLPAKWPTQFVVEASAMLQLDTAVATAPVMAAMPSCLSLVLYKSKLRQQVFKIMLA
jgi:hypothetical protein